MEFEEPVSVMFALYLERSDLRPASVDFRQRACDYFIRWFGDPPVGRVTLATAQSYRTMLGKGRSPASVLGYLNNFKPFWKWLRANDYVSSNPFEQVSLRVNEQKRREGFSRDDLSMMMMSANPLERIQICLGLLGCRLGEMFNVLLRDVYLDAPRPYLQLTAKTASDRTWQWGTKNHRIGLIGLPPVLRFETMELDLIGAIRARMEELRHEPDAYLCVPAMYVERMLWVQAQGLLTWRRIKDPTGVHCRQFRRLQKRAGIREPKRFHELRAAFITCLLDAGIPLARVARAARHARVETTMRYYRKTDLLIMDDVNQVMGKVFAPELAKTE